MLYATPQRLFKKYCAIIKCTPCADSSNLNLSEWVVCVEATLLEPVIAERIFARKAVESDII